MLNVKHRDTLNDLKAGKLTDEAIDVMTTVAADLSAKYKK
jgi:F-type H+-transporting ATPase subunit alpha